jgi:hypothetical protein
MTVTASTTKTTAILSAARHARAPRETRQGFATPRPKRAPLTELSQRAQFSVCQQKRKNKWITHDSAHCNHCAVPRPHFNSTASQPQGGNMDITKSQPKPIKDIADETPAEPVIQPQTRCHELVFADDDLVARVRAAREAAEREMQKFGDISEYTVTKIYGQRRDIVYDNSIVYDNAEEGKQ